MGVGTSTEPEVGDNEGATAAEMIADLQARLAEVQDQHAAVLGRYVGLLRERTDVVPEMLDGASLEEVDRSLARSRAAFEKLAQRLGQGSATEGVAPKNELADGGGLQLSPRVKVPAGGAARRSGAELLTEEARRLSPVEKIRLGLESGL